MHVEPRYAIGVLVITTPLYLHYFLRPKTTFQRQLHKVYIVIELYIRHVLIFRGL